LQEVRYAYKDVLGATRCQEGEGGSGKKNRVFGNKEKGGNTGKGTTSIVHFLQKRKCGGKSIYTTPGGEGRETEQGSLLKRN